MDRRRVVITGIGAVSPYGWGLSPLAEGLRDARSSLSPLPIEEAIGGMLVRVCGKAPAFNEKTIPREYRRAMSRTGILGFVAAREALAHAGVEPSTPLAEPHLAMGVSISSTTVSPATLEVFFRDYPSGVETARSTVFFKAMGHAVPSNICVAFGLHGRCLSPAAACASSLQSIGLAYECIAAGKADSMLAGGAEEFHPLLPATFDRIGAASHNQDPAEAARPFDAARDGIVCSEGAGVILLEEYERATARGATVLAEITGFFTNTSPSSIAFPDSAAIEACMRGALADAGIRPEETDLVNAHATATEFGDIAEGQAIERIFGSRTPVNSLKGYMGHAMAASGALELAAVITAARQGYCHGTHNLESPDPRCGRISLSREHQARTVRCLVKNSFGLGGVNTSLVVRL